MTTQPQRNVLELIRSAAARGAAVRSQERSCLLLEDLLDDPIEWSLSEGPDEGAQLAGAMGRGVSIH